MGTLSLQPAGDAPAPRAPPVVKVSTAPPLLSLLIKLLPSYRVHWLPRCIACLGLLLSGFSIADSVVPFPALRVLLLVVLSLPLLYLFWQIDDAATRHEAQRSTLADLLTRSELRCADLTRELSQERASLKDTRDARNAFLMQVVEQVARLGTSLNARWNMLGELRLPKEQDNYVREVKESLHNLDSFVSDSLLLVRADSRQVKLERGPFNLETFLESIVDGAAPLIADKDIDLLYWVNSDVPLQLIGDTSLLHKLVGTIVDSAVQDTHKGEVVVLAKQSGLTPSSFRLCLSLIATGFTLTHEEIELMMAPYPNLSLKSPGLAFSLCNRLVALLDGTMAVTSDKNKGTTIALELPISINRNCPFVEKLAIENIYDLSVFLVDDHAFSADITSRMLRQLGTRVESASDWVSGLNRLKETSFDVALLDFTLPDIDCLDYCKLIRQQSKNPNIVLLVAAFPRYRQQLPTSNAPFTATVVKPLKRSALITALGQALDARKLVASADLAASARRDSMPPPAAQLTVLIAEDNALSQRVLKSLVERAGHLCRVVDDGQQAVDAYLADPNFDAVLMDCRMPVMDGWVATKMIRAHEAETKARRVYIVALTADDAGQEAAIRAGMDDYLVKPVNKAALLKVFHQLLERKLVPPQKQKADRQCTILLAEDNPVAANVASVVLRQHYHVDVAPHGRMAVEMVKANRASYDLILMDADLPLVDNRTCVEHIREYESELAKHPQPIIALAAGDTNSVAAYLEAGYNDVVKKPVDYPDLLSRVHKILQRNGYGAKNGTAAM